MLIDSYRFGSIVIDGKRYTSDVIIYPDRVDADWWRKEGHQLHIEDLRTVLEEKPDVLVVGTGSPGLMRVPPATRDQLEAQGIELIVEPTDRAWRTYNQMQGARRVIAAFHLTC